MSGLDIFLVIVGLLIVAVSYFISEKMDIGGQKEIKNPNMDIYQNQIEELDYQLSLKAEETITKVDDSLSRISNEKIMAMSEFSDQILEKIEQNHSEVIFLYNMLNEKGDTIKELMKKVSIAEKNLDKKTEDFPMENEPDTQMRLLKKVDNSGQGMEIDLESNHNDIILKLYRQGKSVFDISKELEIGQGEVKLVIDLFQGEKG